MGPIYISGCVIKLCHLRISPAWCLAYQAPQTFAALPGFDQINIHIDLHQNNVRKSKYMVWLHVGEGRDIIWRWGIRLKADLMQLWWFDRLLWCSNNCLKFEGNVVMQMEIEPYNKTFSWEGFDVRIIALFHWNRLKKMGTYNRSLRDIVEKNEIAEHGDEAEKTKSSHNIDHCVLQVKLPWKHI